MTSRFADSTMEMWRLPILFCFISSYCFMLMTVVARWASCCRRRRGLFWTIGDAAPLLSSASLRPRGDKVGMAAVGLHIKCRHPNVYQYRTTTASGDPDCSVTRTQARSEVPDELVPWSAAFESYDPVVFTAPHLKTAPWADPDILAFKPRWNGVDDGKVDRRSHEGEYLVRSGVALNVRGRTGLAGRGVLGRYGPNHAADPIVTRWKRSSTDGGQISIHQVSGKRILQFVAIQRKDTDEWAIPGGMVDPGEHVSETVKREFMEEALDSTGHGRQAAVEGMRSMVDDFFARGLEVYRGYVDDPRNTDNAWMETVAFLFHDETGDSVGRFDLAAGDDAKDLRWVDASGSLKLYASHASLVKEAADKLGAHW